MSKDPNQRSDVHAPRQTAGYARGAVIGPGDVNRYRPPVAPGPDYDPGCEAPTSTGGRCGNHPAQFFVDLGNGQLGRRCGLCLDGIQFLTGARHLIASGVDREKVLRHCVWTCVGPKGVPSL